MVRYGRRRVFKKRRYKRKAKGVVAKVGKKLMRDAKKRGTNSRLEAAVRKVCNQQIAKKIAPNLVFRRYLWSDYNNLTHEFTNQTPVFMGGLVCGFFQLPLWDSSTTPIPIFPAPGSQQPDVNLHPPTQNYNYGQNLVGPLVSKNGFREGTQVNLKNISIELKFEWAALAGAVPLQKDCTICYQLCTLGGDEILPVQALVPASELVTFPRMFGYSNRLDTDASKLSKLRILKKGYAKLYHSEFNKTEVTRKMFWSGNMAYHFRQGSIFGQQIGALGSKKIFLVLRSDIPAANPMAQTPTVACCVKVGYKDGI